MVGDQLILGLSRSRVASAVAVVAIGAGTLGLAGCGGDSADLPDGVVARVGDSPISQEELDRSVQQTVAAFESQGQAAPPEDSEEYTQVVQQAMQTLVQQKVITAEAAECGEPCAVTEDEVTAELQDIVATEFGDSREEFETFLQSRMLSRAEAREIVRNSLLQQKLFEDVTRGVRFTVDDAREYYDENTEQFETPAGRRVSHILVATEDEAEALRARVTPENFADLARSESTDTGSAPSGGDLGIMQEGQFVPEFEEAAFALEDGEISDPVESQFGFHIITADLVPASTTSFADARQGIIQSQLEARRQEAYTTWAEEALEEWEGRTVYADDDLAPPDEEDAEAAVTDGEEVPAP
ncbi:MAG: peptidylprolyl isomerase [Miltoncostaeaceae bacterium]